MKRYNIYSEHLHRKFGEKVYKLPINLPGTCPNRDGIVGTGGCIFCDEEGAGFQCLPNTFSITNQLEKNKEFFKKRFNADKFCLFSGIYQYVPGLEQFKANVLEATKD